jgi:hypothetical protein
MALMIDGTLNPVPCPRCVHSNPSAARFCTRCGLALVPLAGAAWSGTTPPRPRPYTLQYKRPSSARWVFRFLLILFVLLMWSKAAYFWHVPQAQVAPPAPHVMPHYYYPPIQFPPPQQQPHAPGHVGYP